MKLRAFTVTEINQYMKRLFDHEPILSHVTVEGELSGLKFHQSGHVYFNLKDGQSRIPAVLFKRDMERVTFSPEEGMLVRATGKVSLFDKEGKLTYYVHKLEQVGLGDQFAAFEALKRELEGLGWFENKRKKPLPDFIGDAAVVTSPTGAVIRDILMVTGRRSNFTDLTIYPSLVQGAEAVGTLIDAIEKADSGGHDVIVIARGGGAMEDFMPFNDRRVAEAIFKAKTPVISAVGHETDFTICDFVSDLRASTPSSAAELITVDSRQLERELDTLKNMLERRMTFTMRERRERLENLSPIKRQAYVLMQLAHAADQAESAMTELVTIMKRRLDESNKSLDHLADSMNRLNPLNTLTRGYAVVEGADGCIIDGVGKVDVGDDVTLHMKDGKVLCEVKEITKEVTHG